MLNDMKIKKEYFKTHACPYDIDRKILWSISKPKKILRLKYILMPSLLTLGIFFSIMYISTAPSTNLNEEDKAQINIALELLEESIAEVNTDL